MNAAALFVQPKNITMNKYENPELLEIISQLQTEFAPYKYTVYRCAAKVVKLQKYLYTSQISNKLVETIIQQHCLGSGVNFQYSLMIPPFQITALIGDIYNCAEKLGNFKSLTNFELDKSTNILSNFFWNIFDPKRRHSISLLEIKVTLLLLCKSSSNCHDIIQEFYKLIHDHKSKYVLKLQFENLLNIFAKILSYIGESNAYGLQNVSDIIEQSFAKCNNPLGLTLQQFENLWFSNKTKFHIYANLIVTIKRIESTEKLIHNNSCASCGVNKIIGIRFKCRKCHNLSLCMKCFTSGFTTSRHRAGHAFHEMLTEDAPPKKMTHFFAKLCNVFFAKPAIEEAKSFCNSNETNTPIETELVTIAANVNTAESTAINSQTQSHLLGGTPAPKVCAISTVDQSIAGLSTTALNASEVSARLQTIIDRILIQNFKIEQYLQFVPSASPAQISEFLRAHQKFLKDIIKEMRSFKIAPSSTTAHSYPTSSTPNHSGSLNKAVLLDSSNITMNTNNLTHSIDGADVNRSYLEANKSDFSLSDVSIWFNQRSKWQTQSSKKPNLDSVTEAFDDDVDNLATSAADMRETEMTNFRILLNKVREIVEDSYSDNTELAAATQNLENVLDSIIKDEESQRFGLK